jgi:predicted amidohydrolase
VFECGDSRGRKGEVVESIAVTGRITGTRNHGRWHNSCHAQPVFDRDFGKLGIQICYDMEFADGWTELARQARN